MALRVREELIGKRFLAIHSGSKLKLSRICDWEWRSGVVRAVSHKNSHHPELAVLVEFDDYEWKRREWVRIQTTFQVFLLETNLVYAQHGNTKWCPALLFKPFLPTLSCGNTRVRPLQFFPNHQLGFVEEGQIQPFKEGETCLTDPDLNTEELQLEVKQWIDFQNGLGILLTTPSVLVGYRVQVYRTEGTTQWYTAVIQSYNEKTHELHVTDDTVLEEHYEDPVLVQMNLLGDGVVDSILRGEDIGITPRRRACNNKTPSSQTGNSSSTASTSGSSKKSSVNKTATKSAGIKAGNQSKTKVKQKVITSPTSTDIISPQGQEELIQSSISNKKRKSTETSDSQKPAVAPSPKKRAKPSQRQLLEETKITVALERTAISEPTFVIASGIGGSSKPQVLKKLKPLEGSLSKSGKNKQKKQVCTAICKVKTEKLNNTSKLNVNNTLKSDKDNIEITKPKTKKAKPKLQNKTENVILNEGDKLIFKSVQNNDKSGDVNDSGATYVTKSADINIQGVKADEIEQNVVSTNSADEKTVRHLSLKDSDPLCSEEASTMHYKKIRILAESKKVDTAVATSDSNARTISESELNLNHSVTDQIAKLNSVKGEKLAWNNNDLATNTAYDTVNHAMTVSSDSMYNGSNSSALGDSDLNSVVKSSCSDVKTDTVQNIVAPQFDSGSTLKIKVKEEKDFPFSSVSSARSPTGISLKGVDGICQTSSTNSSPLVFNKDEPIKVYRDPELLKKDAEVRQIHNISSGKAHHETTTPVPQSSAYPSVHNPVATPLPSSMTASAFPQSQILSSIPAYAQQLSQLGILASGQHISLSGHTYDPASPLRGISALAAQQQALQLQYGVLLQQQQQQQQLMSQFSIAGGVPTNHLEMLWQQKYPSLPVPPPWMLLQYQEELLRDVNPVRERELVLERERREMEQQQALEREKSERERAERSRKEREKAEQDKRERDDREKAEKLERERQEKELRIEREKQAKLERGRVLQESAATAAVVNAQVNAHFLESFRNMKAVAAGTWTPSISIGHQKQTPPNAHSHHQGTQSRHSIKQEHGKRAKKDSSGSAATGHQTSYKEMVSRPVPTTKGYPIMESSHKLRDVLLKTPAATVISKKKKVPTATLR